MISQERTAIAFLSKSLHEETLRFANEIAEKTKFNVYIIIDDEEPMRIKSNVAIIQVTDEIATINGYRGCNIDSNSTHIKKSVIAYDKCLFYFCEMNPKYEFIWIMEDDCFIPSVDTIVNLHSKYSGYDLVTPNNFKKTDNAMDWHWHSIVDKIEPLYYYSMVCAMGISKATLNCVKEYVQKNDTLFYIEVMFNTLCMQNNLKCIDAFELKSVVWQGKWDIDEFILLPDNIFHPRKDLENYPKMREMIEVFRREGYEPTNNLPEFITNLMVS